MPMFERLQKPYLTVETGEAYQPIRLTYQLTQKDLLVETLNNLKCCEKNPHANSWNWFWKDESDDLHFESLDSYKKNPDRPLRIGTIIIRDQAVYFNLPSFKRACLAVPFFYKILKTDVAKIYRADFINKVFGTDERLPHGFAELFKDDELDKIVNQRISDYEEVKEQCEQAATAEEALNLLTSFTQKESTKRLPYAERYDFTFGDEQDADIIFLGFYIYLRSRELVAIRRWFGETGYTLSDYVEEMIQEVFGDMNIDIIE